MAKKYIGVQSSSGGRYRARVIYKDIDYYLGTFNDPEEAAKAYDDKLYELKGDNPKNTFNFPERIAEINSRDDYTSGLLDSHKRKKHEG